MKTNRIEPLPIPLDDEMQTVMNKVFPATLPSPVLYRIVARNDTLFKQLVETRFIGPTGLFDRKILAPPLREKIILRTCIATRNQYEFALHENTISLRMGVTTSQIADIKNQIISEDYWEEKDIILFELIDNLVNQKIISDELFNNISKHYGETELIEIIHIIGFYTGVGMMVSFTNPRFDNYKI